MEWDWEAGGWREKGGEEKFAETSYLGRVAESPKLY